jgi:hypothetical protein
MQHQYENSAVVGRYEHDGEMMDVCAEVISDYNEAESTLTSKLDSYLRYPDPAHARQRVSMPWLPQPQTCTEGVPLREANELAREISRSWRKNVFSHIPQARHGTGGGTGPLLLCMM